ncbi:MAG: DNA polymerase IV, partial [Muribaculaceae bacterium]|nr:DNA polymerase IV [Muribaculaceae bacterium]
MRKIIHIDMDAFFASVEQREHPELRGKPLAVGFDGPRGVVATASYEARPFGVHSAMPMSQAKRLCPQLQIVPCNFALYKEVSAQVHAVFHEHTDIIEPISIDEAFLDVTVNKQGIEMARSIAIDIKRKIKERTGLTASAGVSYCKFLAKIASDYRKPDGLFVVHPRRALDFVARLPIESFWGVGPRTAERMHALGIFNGEQLRAQSLDFLNSHFGKMGQVYYDFARGIDERPVVTERERKSVGCEETFLEDIYLPADIEREIAQLAADLERRIERAAFHGRTLTLKVKYHDFTQITRSLSGDQEYKTASSIIAGACELLQHAPISKDRPVRLLGLSLSNPKAIASVPPKPAFPSLFDT